MKELETARKVLGIMKEIADGVDTTRTEILETAGRARRVQLADSLSARREAGAFAGLSEKEIELQFDIIASLDQMSRRMPHALPRPEIERVELLIDELDEVRQSRSQFPVSPGVSIWRGCLSLRRHDFSKAFQEFERAIDLIEPIVSDDPSFPPTLVTALCEAAYSLAMLNDMEHSIAISDKGISVAREFRTEDALLVRILREQYIAGEFVTMPLATAYLTACDVRVNLTQEWDPESELATHFLVYWNLLNDECGALSALEVPYLIAILSDRNWMARKPELSAPIARALYLRTSASIPQALWRKANLFIGGFSFSESVNDLVKTGSTRTLCAFLILALLGFGGAEGIARTPNDISKLSSEEVASIFAVEGVQSPNGSEILQGLDMVNPSVKDLGVVADGVIGEALRQHSNQRALEVATGSSSMVATKLV